MSAQPPKPPAPRVKPVRYWPGKAPAGAAAHQSSDSDSDDDENQAYTHLQHQKGRSTTTDHEISEVSSSTSHPHRPPPPAPPPDAAAIKGDRRLMRLQQSREDVAEADGDNDKDSGSRRPGRRREVVTQSGPIKAEASAGGDAADADAVKHEEEDEDEVSARRARMREAALKKRQEEEALLEQQERDGAGVKDEADDGSEYTSEYTTDSEDDIVPSRTLLKPVFIKKNQRETILEKERLEAEAAAAEEARLLAAEEKKRESHNMVAEELRREQAAAEVTTAAPEVDDTDNVNEEEEYAAWKLRELRRIKRDREEADAREAAIEDLERRRNMTDAEIMAEKRKEGTLKDHGGADKPKHRFMQKYFHKGAFFVDDEAVGKVLQTRDFAEPTLEDKFDKSALPSVMQVKNFGRAGQTKWTHLTDQDTSKMDSPWFQKSEVNKRNINKLGGMKQGFDKPTAKRRKI
ncbi:Microfibrillar-associated protein 1 [Geranomyces michiganensis]|nr:Microfibrillar-associated protein 1 [Geranomyces michiganensis]